PPSTSLATTDIALPTPERTFGDVLDRIAHDLDDSGYDDARWYPIGARYRHGFALTTRLEGIADDATPLFERDRWHGSYPEPLTLRWLANVREVPVSSSERYRAFLLAFTDLPLTPTQVAPRWNEETVMEGPGIPEATDPSGLPRQRAAPRSFRLGIYVYEYEGELLTSKGTFMSTDDSISAPEHVRASGLAKLLDVR
ncbi:MAG TPA: hypothetical protein VJT73_00385, partial [Polyangiaceae bacterium]|nr:hypothetical protein [Polyangiaceae bacterium]